MGGVSQHARPPAAQLTFSTTYAASFGDRLYVCGSPPELGAWDAARAVPLHWNANDIWSARVAVAPPAAAAPSRFEYKFLVAAAATPDPRASARAPLWEPGDNHAADVAAYTARAALPHAWGDASAHDIPPGSAGAAAQRPCPTLAASPPPTPAPRSAVPAAGPGDPVTLAVERLASSASASNGGGVHAASADAASADAETDAAPSHSARDVPVVFRVSIPSAGRHADDAVYLVGSCPSLGSWNKAHSPRMRPVTELRASAQRCDAVDQPHDAWQIAMVMPVDADHKRFEYKYLVRTHAKPGLRVWEPGPNRVAVLSDDPSLSEMIWDDRWERVRCEFSIFFPADEGNVMHITGDPPEIGGWFKPGPVPLELGAVERLETDVDGRKWRLVVWLPSSTTSFAYRYILVDKETNTKLWEREPNRHADFAAMRREASSGTQESQGMSNGHVVAGVDSRKATDCMPWNSVYILKDVNFVTSMKFDAVPPDMFIGPYPQTPEDVDSLADAGATAVFNVQTDEDFSHRGVKWDVLMERYNERKVEVVRFPIRDFDRSSLADRIHDAAHELDRLISGGKKVYIHCTAGMGRAPACAVAYLCWVRGYSLDDAVRHVKKHRPVAVPNVPVLEEALQRPF